MAGVLGWRFGGSSWRPDRVVNHVRLCFIAYWLNARLAQEWQQKGVREEVSRTLRRLQTIRLGRLRVLGKKAPSAITPIPTELNDLLIKIDRLRLFAAPPKWAEHQPS